MDKAAFLKGLKEYVDQRIGQRYLSFRLDVSSGVDEPKGYTVEDQNLSQYVVQEKKPSFSEILFRLIDERGLDEVEVYKRARMDRRLFSRIRSSADYQPSKRTVFSLIIALQLQEPEASQLLDAAGYSFSFSLPMDLILRYHIKRRVYDMDLFNVALEEYELEPIGCAR